MALLAPCPGPVTSLFAFRALAQDFAYWHRGSEDAAFNWYSVLATYSPFHAGQDFAPGLGHPIVASEDGVVAFAGPAPSPHPFAGGGLIVDIHVAGGMDYVSCHCSALHVRSGDRVKRGQHIADVGQTGNALGPHDHFSLYTGAGPSFRLHNPAHFLPGGKYANSPLIQPAYSPVHGLTAIVGPGTVTGFKIDRYSHAPISSKVGNWARASSAGTVHSSLAGYYLVSAGYYAGYYLITGKSGPFVVRGS